MREYNCRKSVGTRAGLRDSRYSRTANTVHGAGGKGTQSGKFLEVLLALFTDTSTGRVEQTSKVWTSNYHYIEMQFPTKASSWLFGYLCVADLVETENQLEMLNVWSCRSSSICNYFLRSFFNKVKTLLDFTYSLF